MYYKEDLSMSTISFRISDDLEKVIKGKAKLQNKTVSTFIIDLLKETIEDEDDYRLAMATYKTIDMDDKTTLEGLCAEVGIDYY